MIGNCRIALQTVKSICNSIATHHVAQYLQMNCRIATRIPTGKKRNNKTRNSNQKDEHCHLSRLEHALGENFRKRFSALSELKKNNN